MLTYKKIKGLLKTTDATDLDKLGHKKRNYRYDPKLNYTPARGAKVILKVKDLVKTFNPKSKKKKVQVLKGINLNIYDGDRIALIGKNGAGKTTFIEILSGVQDQTSGDLHFGYNYTYSPFEKVGVQFQNSHYPQGLSVNDIIRFMINTRRNITIHPNEKKEMIEKFGLSDLLKSEANGLSGGQRQRLNILLSLVVSPKLVFLDELTTGLDVYSQKVILEYIKKYIKAHDATLISVSHNVLEIEELANRIVLLKDGNIAIDADVAKVRKSFKSIADFVVNFLG